MHLQTSPNAARRVTRALEQQAAADEKRSSGAPVTPHAVYVVTATDCATPACRLLPARGPGARPDGDPAGPGKENGRAAASPSPQQATPAAMPNIPPHSRVRTPTLCCLTPTQQWCTHLG